MKLKIKESDKWFYAGALMVAFFWAICEIARYLVS